MERLDKFLSNNGAGTRSQVKLLLKQGRVTADGICVKDGSVKIDPDRQRICVDGESLGQAGRVVVMLHKPEGFVTATEDPRDKTVMELLPKQLQHLDLKPVGRLDKATEGLLLFTNDGDLLHRLISPKNEIPKVYYARHEGEATTEDVRAFARGVTLKDGTLCRGALLEPLGPGQSRITVCEGKYHQVRRMMASRNMPVTYLQRQAEGTLQLGQLPVGQVRMLTPEEIGGLEQCKMPELL